MNTWFAIDRSRHYSHQLLTPLALEVRNGTVAVLTSVHLMFVSVLHHRCQSTVAVLTYVHLQCVSVQHHGYHSSVAVVSSMHE